MGVLGESAVEAVRRLREKRPEPDWQNFRACPVCKVKLGEPCVILSGRGVDGLPVPVQHYRAHAGRRRRSRRGVEQTF